MSQPKVEVVVPKPFQTHFSPQTYEELGALGRDRVTDGIAEHEYPGALARYLERQSTHDSCVVGQSLERHVQRLGHPGRLDALDLRAPGPRRMMDRGVRRRKRR